MSYKHQQCPECGGAIPTEHTAVETLISHEIKFLYCEFCGYGLESAFKFSATGMDLTHSVPYSEKKHPVKFGEFLQRLKNARLKNATSIKKTICCV